MKADASPNLRTLKLFALFVAAALAGFYLLSSVLIAVIIAFTLYALFEPAALYLVRQGVNPSLSILAVLLFLVLISLLALGLALPALFEQITVLQSKLPGILSQLERLAHYYGERASARLGSDIDVSEITMSALSQSTSVGQTVLINLTNRVLEIVILFLLVPFLTYYLLKDYKQLRNRLMDWLPNSSFELGWLIYHNATRQLQSYTRGVMYQSLVMSLICAIGFSWIGLDIPILLGFITGVLNLVPYIGPVISILLALLVGAAMTPFDPAILYLAPLVIVFAQLIDNLVVIPRVIASAVDLHPVQVILGIIVMGSLFGTLGVVLAIPAIATGKIVYDNLYADILNESLKETP